MTCERSETHGRRWRRPAYDRRPLRHDGRGFVWPDDGGISLSFKAFKRRAACAPPRCACLLSSPGAWTYAARSVSAPCLARSFSTALAQAEVLAAILARQIARRRAVCGQEEHLKVWRSKPGIVAMSARTTPVNSIFAPQAAHCIAHFSPCSEETHGARGFSGRRPSSLGGVENPVRADWHPRMGLGAIGGPRNGRI